MLKKNMIGNEAGEAQERAAAPKTSITGRGTSLNQNNLPADKLPIDIRSALKEAFHQLREAKVPSHTLAAELLLMHVLGHDRTWLYAHPEQLLERAVAKHYFELVKRRSSGVPTQYLNGKQEFWGLEFEVSPSVLIPRPETEHVIEVALDRLGHRGSFFERSSMAGKQVDGEGLKIADVGTGSGCIAIALAKELPRAQFYATDISSEALQVARRNAQRYAVRERIQFLQCNLLDRVPLSAGEARCLDMIASNPPYVGLADKEGLQREVRDHEPEAALYGGEEGTDVYGPLVRGAAVRLKPGGKLVLELGYNSLSAVSALVANQAWTNVAVTNDLAGIPRVLAAERL